LFEYLEHNNLTGDNKVAAQTIALSRYLTIQTIYCSISKI